MKWRVIFEVTTPAGVGRLIQEASTQAGVAFVQSEVVAGECAKVELPPSKARTKSNNTLTKEAFQQWRSTQAIMEFFQKAPKGSPIHYTEVCTVLTLQGFKPESASPILSRAVAFGLLKRTGSGLYTLPEEDVVNDH